MNRGFRCSAASRASGEPVGGTASTVRRFLLVEERGPWGVDAVADSRLPDTVKAHLAALRDRERIRPLLVRPCAGTRPVDGVQVFLADVGSGALTGTTLTDVSHLRDLDLAALPAAEGPLFLTCTHGRHDTCCAELGRPLARALAEVEPLRAWEVSHIGGDRFAPNLVVLPHGLYYGRLDPAQAADFVTTHLDGRLDLDHLRGRTVLPFPAQSAEIHLRRELGEDRIGAVRHLGTRRDGDDRLVDLAVGERTFEVRMRPVTRPAERLTCRATRASAVVAFEAVEVSGVARD